MTSWFQSKLLLKKVYHTIYLFQPSHSTASLKDNIFEDLPNKYDELTYETLNDCLDKIKNEQENLFKNTRILFYFNNNHTSSKVFFRILLYTFILF